LSSGRYVSAYDTYGYLPLYSLTQVDTFPCPVSRSLEYAFNDYCIAIAAKKTGREELSEEFMKRSKKALILFHPEKKLFWAKYENGNWFPDYDPAHFFHPWTGPYYEGSAYQYSMGAPHLTGHIIAAHGGKTGFVDFLDRFFEGGYYTPTNEPNLHIPWLYNFAGRPDRASACIRDLMNQYYSGQRDGLPGDDDSGTMSAWYVWASLGIFAMPGTDVYLIASPVFEQAVIELGNGKELTIRAKNLSEKNIYVNSATMNGRELDRAWFRHHEIIQGAEIELQMSDKPNDWGTLCLPRFPGDIGTEVIP
jgi:predicted alpha-1,2-mannosidase